MKLERTAVTLLAEKLRYRSDLMERIKKYDHHMKALRMNYHELDMKRNILKQKLNFIEEEL